MKVLGVEFFFKRRKTATINVWAINTRNGKKSSRQVTVELLNKDRNIFAVQFEGKTIYVGVEI